MNRALCVGINHYENVSPLSACETDARNMSRVLRTHGDGSPNFGIELKTGDVTERDLKSMINKLFATPVDMALFYFAGHGIVTSTGGCLMTTDATDFDEGVSMDDVLLLANKSCARNRIIILDCCHSGAIAMDRLTDKEHVEISEGVSVLAASRASEPAIENAAGGLFTSLVVSALKDAAADVLGTVTLGSIYSFVDQALGPWDQRPIFMTNVSRYAPVRKVKPRVPVEVIRRLSQYFGSAIEEFPLDRSYEEDEKEHADSANVKVFKELQKLVSIGLVEPVGEEHMYYAAINEKACRLTPLGRRYWQLATNGRI